MHFVRSLCLLLLACGAWAQDLKVETATIFDKIQPELMTQLEQLERDGSLFKDGSDLKSLRVVIHLADEEDVNFETMRGENVAALVAESVARAQAKFLGSLGDSGLRDGQDDFRVVNLVSLNYALAAEVSSKDAISRLALRSDVTYIQISQLYKLLTVQGRSLTGSTTAASNGYTGSGVGVAVIDSHFDLLHSELGGSTTLPNSIVKGGQNFSDPGTSIHSQNFNDCYHGTGTASIVRRYATQASLYCLTVFPNAYDDVIANAINWCVTNRNGVGGGSPIRVISMSLGGGRYYNVCNSGLMHDAAGNALSQGILVFAASGNDGWTTSMGSPACSDNVISVGSVWDATNANYSPFPPANCSDSSRQVNERTCYSDTASFLDIYMPSEEVICARCAGGTFALGGTSSACPAAAGITAQMLHAKPEYIGQKSTLVNRYQSTGVQVIGDTSKRRVDLTAALGTITPAPTASFSASPSTITQGQSASLSWSTTNATSTSINNGVGTVTPVSGGSVNVTPSATTTYTLTVTGAGGTITRTATVTVNPAGSQLQNGVAQNFTVAQGATRSFTISLPSGATNLTVAMTGNGDADLYVKRTAINWPGDQGAHNEAEFKAPYTSSSNESVNFPTPASGTWNVLVHGYNTSTVSLTATWTVGGTQQWYTTAWVKETPHNYANSKTYTFTYSKAGASQVGIHFTRLDTETNYDWLYVYDQNNQQVFKVSGNLINNGTGSAFGRSDGYAIVNGSSITIKLVTDGSVVRYGFKTDVAAYYQ